MSEPKTENIKLKKIKKISKSSNDIPELPDIPPELLLPPKEIVYNEEMVEFEKKHTVKFMTFKRRLYHEERRPYSNYTY